uniref:Zinc finger protein 462-like n=1 Tax=Sparus aurata TaxID=8175 RepID=A0A671UGB7_SPAAU
MCRKLVLLPKVQLWKSDSTGSIEPSTKNLSFSGYLPLPLVNEGDENMFFCHFCNYRHSNLPYVMVHFMKQHRGFGAQSAQVSQYTSMVHSQTQKSHLKTTVRATEQTQRSLQCHRCAYSTQTVSVLRRHLWKTHRANRSVMEVLKVCFRQGNVQTGYHCDLCVFSHEEALAIYKHYQEQHPVRKLSNGTDGSSLSQRSGQNEAKMYSCKACSFKSSSMSGITSHYRAVHPWSVKEDGSVLDVTDSKRQSANQQLEDHNERPVSFDTYQAPLEFENSPGSSHKAAPHKKAQKIKCPFCPASFPTKHGLSVHCGMKHHEGVSKNLDTPQEEQEQIQNRVHVFKCPHCTYVNTNYQGVLTHCQMRHPALISRADSLYVDEAHLHNWEDCVKSNGPGFKLCGYMCETCPQICASLEKLNKHFEEGHNETEGNTVPNEPKSAPPPSAVGKRKKHKSHVNQGSVSKASFFNKKTYVVLRCQSCSYQCTTKLGLARHLQIRHKNASLSKVLDGLYKCALCSNFYFKKKRLGSHYAKKHGKEAFLKYYAPVYNQEFSTPETCQSNTTLVQDKKPLYNKRKARKLPKPKPVESAQVKCKMCPDLTFDSSQLLIDHFSTCHNSDRMLDFIVLSQASTKTTGLYKCALCNKQMNGIRKLSLHLDRHRETAKEMSNAAMTKASLVIKITPEAKTIECIKSKMQYTNVIFSISRTVNIINKYVVYKTGTLRPFLCSFCTFRTTCIVYHLPPDVQRQLNHYSLMAKAGAASKANVQETQMDNRLLYCEVCNFNTEYLSSMRRHYLNRHGKKIFRCKDCDYFTGSRKTLEMHVETGHSTCQSKPTHQRDLRCPFCLYQTKNKNNMIDHIVLHREERVVPIEVRRPKLSRYLQGIVFRCHKCTFTCGSPENLRLHMTRHDDIKPYKCRLCYFDCPQLGDLEAHLSDKHQVRMCSLTALCITGIPLCLN